MLVLRCEPRGRLFIGRENDGVVVSWPSGKKSARSPRCDVGDPVFPVWFNMAVANGGEPLGDCVVDRAVVVERVGCSSPS
jgi:hypothetical protein